MGCVSLPKPLYFTMDMTTPPGQGTGSTVLQDRLVEIDAIRVTDKLVRRDILIRLGATELEYYHDALWVSRLSDIVAEKLRAEFATTPGEHRANLPVLSLYGTLLACEQVDQTDGATYAHLKLHVTLRPAGSSRFAAPVDKTYEFYEPVDPNGPFPAVVVSTLSEGLAILAGQIAADANAITLDESAP
jgi:hypothetical protein